LPHKRYFDFFDFFAITAVSATLSFLHQRFELREGEVQNLNCLLQLRRHHELLPQPEVMSEFYFESHW